MKRGVKLVTSNKIFFSSKGILMARNRKLLFHSINFSSFITVFKYFISINFIKTNIWHLRMGCFRKETFLFENIFFDISNSSFKILWSKDRKTHDKDRQVLFRLALWLRLQILWLSYYHFSHKKSNTRMSAHPLKSSSDIQSSRHSCIPVKVFLLKKRELFCTQSCVT